MWRTVFHLLVIFQLAGGLAAPRQLLAAHDQPAALSHWTFAFQKQPDAAGLQLSAMVVNTLDDELNADGDCSLREAVEAANTNLAVDACPAGEAEAMDSIGFAVNGTITLAQAITLNNGGPVEVVGNLDADDQPTITLDGGGTTRILEVAYSNHPVRLENLTITNGSANNGGGIFVDGDLLEIHHCTFTNNQAAGYGGAISGGGLIRISDSTFASNQAADGGAIHHGGYYAIFITSSTFAGNQASNNGGGLRGVLFIVSNSTFSGNQAGGYGGGIYEGGIYSWGGVISHSTFDGNSASQGGALYTTSEKKVVVVSDSILANSPSGGECATAYAGPLMDGGHNLDSGSTCGFDPVLGSLSNTDPLLGPLQDNGGPTLTYALLPGSPAIDAARQELCLESDQRGFAVPVDGDGDGEAECDIGAVEYGSSGQLSVISDQLSVISYQSTIQVDTLEDELNGDGDCSLREAIEAANTNLTVDACPAGNAVITDTITFALSGTIALGSELLITGGGPLLIDGGGQVRLDGRYQTRILHAQASADLALLGLELVHGWIHYSADGGGGLWNEDGRVRLADCRVLDNLADSGSGIYNSGVLTVTHSLLSGNGEDSYHVGGALANNGTTWVSHSTLAFNWAGEGGGALYNNGTLYLDNSRILSNASQEGGGGIASMGTMAVENSAIAGNLAMGYNSGGGGGMQTGSSQVDITNSLIVGNLTFAGFGGGLLAGGNTQVSNSLFLSNGAIEGGGGIFGMLNISDSTVYGNQAFYSGGGMNIYNSTIIDTLIANNDAEDGAGIRAGQSTVITNSTITNNWANASGGGLVSLEGASVYNSTFYNNHTSGQGSEIYAVALVQL